MKVKISEVEQAKFTNSFVYCKASYFHARLILNSIKKQTPMFSLFVESDCCLAGGQETDISHLKIKGQVSIWHSLAVKRKIYLVSFNQINIHSNTMEFAYILDEPAKLSNYDKVFFSIIIWSIYAQKLNQDTVSCCHGKYLANEDRWHS